MPINDIIIYGALIPAVVAGVIQLAAWFADKGKNEKLIARPGTSTAYIAALFTGFFSLIGAPALPPVDAADVIIVGAILAALIGLLDAIYTFPMLLQFLYRAVIAVVVGWYLLNPTNEYLHESSNGFILLGVFVLVTFAVWRALSYGHDHRGAKNSFTLLVLLAMATMSMMMAGSLKFGEMSVMLTATVGASWVVALIRPRFSLAPGGIGAVAIMFTGLLFGAHYYAELPLTAMILLLVATLPSAIARATKLRHRFGDLPTLGIIVGAIVILAGLAFFFTYQSSPPLEPYDPY